MNPPAFSKELGVNTTDFYRFLHKIASEEEYTEKGNCITIPLKNSGRVEIHHSEEKSRVLSPLIQIPYMEVQIYFFDVSMPEQELFLTNFKWAFHRGGG